jgi:hypothetical protein
MIVTGLDLVELSHDFESSAAHIDLRPWQWHFLHAIDGRMEVRNVAAACGVDLSAAIAFVEEVHASGLLRVITISLADYRSANASAPVALVAVETATEPVGTTGDHFSSTEMLPAYEHPVPAWMMEPQPPIEYEHEPVLAHEEIAEAAEEHPVTGEYAFGGQAASEEYSAAKEFAVAEDPVYEPDVASGPGEFADLLGDPVAHDEAPQHEAVPDEAALAFMHEEATASQAVADLVARHHETNYSQHDYFTASTAPAQEEPVSEASPDHTAEDVTHDAPEPTPEYVAEHAPEYVAEHAPEYVAEHTPEYDAHAQEYVAEHAPEHLAEHAPEHVAEHAPDYVAEHAPEYAAEHALDYTENYAEPVAQVEPEPEVAHGNGRSTAWEPLSLVAHVDEDAPVEHDSFRDPSMPDGVSIWLSHGSSTGVYETAAEEKGSVSFSLSPDDAPDMHPIATDAPGVAQHEHGDPVAAPAAPPAPTYQAPSQDVAGVYSATKEPTNGHIDNSPVAQPGTGTTTADIVGSLISRALTFRIK